MTELAKNSEDQPKKPGRLGQLRKALGDAKAAKQPSGFEFVLADRLDFLNQDHWDELTAGASVFLSRQYLSAFRDAGPRDLMLRAGIIYREATPVACFATQTFDMDGTQLVSSVDQLSDEDKAQLAIKKLTRKALSAIRRRVMVCGNVISWGPHGVAIRDGEDPGAIWTAISEALYRLRRGDKLNGQTDYVMIKDLPESMREQSDSLSRFGYRVVETEPDMQLAIPESWSTLDDYLADLNKKYRKSARSVLKSIDGAGVTLAPLEDVASAGPRLHELYKGVAQRADVRLAGIPAEFFPTVARSLGRDRFATIAASRGDELLGFVTVVRDGETAVGYFLGVDYEANAELPIYHRLLFAVIEQAIEWNCRRVSFGRTALDAKARLGCTPEPTFVWIRHRVPVLNLAVKQLLRAVPHAEPPERNPFKNQPEAAK